MLKDQSQQHWIPQDETSDGPCSAIGVIRLILAFRTKQKIGHERIGAGGSHCQTKNCCTGKPKCSSTTHSSFLIRCENLFLHFNFVCALSNDLFGLQTRGGCACAGTHASKLLGVNKHDLQMFFVALEHGCIILKPRFTRFRIPYFMIPEKIDYILKVIHS
ncbi:unnamed protein product [Albugo candida]|uniref:Uncharacterized protein n=1 Tax=Albugo candida TaxID=65357 RepID=A0A024GB00_9STRA|nr:unnamed protein product [Albugo candida]|eukprot:CCI43913.1 unnamed protein product [Albugo candida]